MEASSIDAYAEAEALVDEFGPRPPGSDAERRAAQHLARRLEEMGREVHVEGFSVWPAWATGYAINAGIAVVGGLEASNEEWQRIWEVNVMAHVYAARAVLPQMLERGDGYLLQTASAAGLLTQVGSAPYSVTKHAAVAFAEWLAITYGDQGIKVSCLCPQGVRTNMLERARGGAFLRDGALDPDRVADIVVAGLRAESFLILPHPEVLDYFRRKSDDYDRWIRGMRRLNEKVKAIIAEAEGQ
jgi:NAD(P)-dependent dehydrogenase (short-subunit alcohol dehydrogenase family)